MTTVKIWFLFQRFVTGFMCHRCRCCWAMLVAQSARSEQCACAFVHPYLSIFIGPSNAKIKLEKLYLFLGHFSIYITCVCVCVCNESELKLFSRWKPIKWIECEISQILSHDQNKNILSAAWSILHSSVHELARVCMCVCVNGHVLRAEFAHSSNETCNSQAIATFDSKQRCDTLFLVLSNSIKKGAREKASERKSEWKPEIDMKRLVIVMITAHRFRL